MGPRRVVVIGIFSIMLVYMLVSGVAFMMPAVDVGAGPLLFNSATGTDILYNFTGTDYLNGSLNVYYQNGSLARSIDTGVHSNGNYSLHWSGDYSDSALVPDGNYTINASLSLNHYMMNSKIGNPNPTDTNGFFPTVIGVNGSGYIFISNYYSAGISNSGGIYVFYPNGTFLTSFNDSSRDKRYCIAFNSSGFIYTTNDYNSQYSISIYYPDYSYYGQFDMSSSGTPQLASPLYIAFNSSNYMYVVDGILNRVYRFSPGGEFISSWGGSGTDPGQFDTPVSMAVDSSGQVYVADTYNGRVQKFDSNGNYLTEWSLSRPISVCIDSASQVYVLDYIPGGLGVKVYDSNGALQRSWTASSNVPILPCSLMAVDKSSGNVIVTDLSITYSDSPMIQCSVTITTSNGSPVTRITGPVPVPGDIPHVTDVAINDSGYIYVLSKTNNWIQVYDPDGNYVYSWSYVFTAPQIAGSYDNVGVDGIGGIAIDSSGNVYVADFNRIVEFDYRGQLIRQIKVFDPTSSIGAAFMGVSLPCVKNIDIGPDGNVYAVCTMSIIDTWGNASRIRIYTPEGSRIDYTIKAYGAADAFLDFFGSLINQDLDLADMTNLMNNTGYNDIAVNSTGFVYVTEPANNSVYIYSPTGILTGAFNGTMAGAGAFSQATDIAINSSDCVFILDQGHSRVVVLDRNSHFLTQFGTAGTGNGQFASPQGIGINPSGEVLAIADTGNNRIQLFEYFGSYHDEAGVTVDNTPPAINCGLSGTISSQGWFESDVVAALSATDSLSGIRSAAYSLDGTNWAVYSGAFTIPIGGQKTLYYMAVDNAGNVAGGSRFVYFPPASFPGGNPGEGAMAATPTPSPLPSPTNTPVPAATPSAGPALPGNSTVVPPVSPTAMPVGHDMLISVVLVLVVVALLRSRK